MNNQRGRLNPVCTSLRSWGSSACTTPWVSGDPSQGGPDAHSAFHNSDHHNHAFPPGTCVALGPGGLPLGQRCWHQPSLLASSVSKTPPLGTAHSRARGSSQIQPRASWSRKKRAVLGQGGWALVKTLSASGHSCSSPGSRGPWLPSPSTSQGLPAGGPRKLGG